MSEIDIRDFDPADDALRAKNAQTVQAFLALTGAELPRRMHLFCEEDDISYGEAFTKTGQPDIATGRAAVQQRLQQLANSYPALTWQGGKILVTADPNYLMADTDGTGSAHNADVGSYQHGGHFIHTFQMQDGKIRHYLQYKNPARELIEMGFTLPAPGEND
ncbi:Phenazine biosynthesis protein phzB 2 [Anaerotruncus sp. 2789STDY5834896]|uniref:Phenazine biosynthesis protein phzB 2 n=1 Tax=uncultured Anaerotruncus sp. TaxID=905011 RepID=A0A1C6J830_9FIRM|nr:Phenazine biosynthesis protein phzB 2 [uncultured Anaerotruncus sp.]